MGPVQQMNIKNNQNTPHLLLFNDELNKLSESNSLDATNILNESYNLLQSDNLQDHTNAYALLQTYKFIENKEICERLAAM